jgi:hypothetical protein
MPLSRSRSRASTGAVLHQSRVFGDVDDALLNPGADMPGWYQDEVDFRDVAGRKDILGHAEECDETRPHLQRCHRDNSDRTLLHIGDCSGQPGRGVAHSRGVLRREDFREREAPVIPPGQ